MCYDVSYLTRKAEKYAKHHGEVKDWKQIQLFLPPAYHVSGFTEPKLPVLIKETNEIQKMHWPFVPFDIAPKAADGHSINTLNARDDKIFNKSSLYYESAIKRRCLVPLDGFFDHQYMNGKSYPFYIQLINKEPLFVAGLWQQVNDRGEMRDCVTLVTTCANKELAWIHNEPAYSPESRMILVLQTKEQREGWLHGSESEAKKLIKPLPDGALQYHTCPPVKANKKWNRSYLGNVPEIQEWFSYPERLFQQGSLF